jgi:hypothetical protein
VTRLTVMLYVRYSLSLRQVEDLLSGTRYADFIGASGHLHREIRPDT